MRKAIWAVAQTILAALLGLAIGLGVVFVLVQAAHLVGIANHHTAKSSPPVREAPFENYSPEAEGAERLNMYQRPGISWTIVEPTWNHALGHKYHKEFRAQLVATMQEKLELHTGWWRAGIRFRYVSKPAEATIVIHPLTTGEISKACPVVDQFGCITPVSPERCTISLAYWVRYVTHEKWSYDPPNPGNVNHTLGQCFGLKVAHGGVMDPRAFSEPPSKRLIARVRKLLNTIPETSPEYGEGKPENGEREIEAYDPHKQYGHPRKKYLYPVERSTDLYRRWVMTWTVLRPRWGSILEQPLRAELHYQLVENLRKQIMNPRGWQRAGVRFRYVARPDEANIIFAPSTSTTIDRDCGKKGVDGCEATWDTGRCVIHLEYDVLLVATNNLRYHPPEEGTVNHEIGHCFNFRHTKGGLMDPRGHGGIEYPSPRLTHELRQELLNPEEATETVEIPTEAASTKAKPRGKK